MKLSYVPVVLVPEVKVSPSHPQRRKRLLVFYARIPKRQMQREAVVSSIMIEFIRFTAVNSEEL